MKLVIKMLVVTGMSVYVSAKTNCEGGEYYVRRSRRRRAVRSFCKKCVPGYWQREQDHQHETCQPCPSGKYTSSAGALQCSGGPVCQKGTVGIIGAVSENESVCKDCVAGRYSGNTGEGPDCMSCPSGLYVKTSKAVSCIGSGTCPLGKYGTMFNTKQGTCNECPVGKITVKTGLFVCSDCPRGQYQLSSGKSSCLPKESCTRWKINQPNAYECVYLYNIDLYITLVTSLWVSFVLSIYIFCSAMEPCMSTSIIPPLTSFGLSIWVSTYHPVNMDDGLSNISFGLLSTYTILIIFACVDYMLINNYGKNYIKSICKKDTEKDTTKSVQIHVDTPNRVSV